jgi:hypothetical protein
MFQTLILGMNLTQNKMLKNVKIWIGYGKDLLSNRVQTYLFSKGNGWNDCVLKEIRYCGTALLINSDGYLMTCNYDKNEFDMVDYKEMKLIETVTYTLEEVKQREKITIGGKEYYIDELEVALKNVKPIKN